MKMICFDMDGTIADLYGVPDWLEKLHNEDASPYQEAKPMWDMERLNTVLHKLIRRGYEIRVISWLAKDSSEDYKQAVRQAKLDWLKRYHFPYTVAHLVAYGTTKANCVRKMANAAVLIDDSEAVRNGWHLGEVINPVECDIIERLEALARGE